MNSEMNSLSIVLIFISASLVRDVYAADGIKTIADRLGERLSELVKKATNYDTLSNIPNNVMTKKLNADVLKNDIENLTKLFNERLSIAKEMAQYAKVAHTNHTKDHRLDENYEYFDAATGDESLLENTTFSKDWPVSLNISAVQTPTDLYQYTVDVLNSIEWTKKLDTKFRENFQNADDNMYKAWQFIGLSNGVFRSYPGSLWVKRSKDVVQYYDVRQRSWYIEGSSPPKDMVIILDLSGSVIGNRLLIIKAAVMSLLDTLQENDFVNIVYFNKNADYLKKCWRYLVQATERNKKILKAAVKSDTVKGANVANVETGFELAFQTLEKSRNSGANRTSNCTQTIAFFTDGVEGDTAAEDVFKKYNSKKNVRVFTYLVGRETGSPFEAIKWIACTNKGFFYRIETLSDVRENIVKYVLVLSRSRNQDPKWTSLYPDAQGLGMVSSLVVPILDKNEKQLGVFGFDVRLDEILSKFPENHLGAGGYTFLITNNGLVFFHPLLKPEKEVALKQPGDVYLSEVLRHFSETNEIEELSRNMINRETKKPSVYNFEKFRVLAKYNNDQFRIVERNLAYSYDYIANTTFSVGMAITDYGSTVMLGKQDDVKDTFKNALNKLSNFKISIASNWPYCPKPMLEWNDLKSNLSNEDKLNECRKKSKDLVNLVIYDILELGKSERVWKPEETNSSEVTAVFFGTTSGLTFSKSVKDVEFDTSIKQDYFERAADSWENQTVIFSAPSQNEVHASKAVVGTNEDSKKVLWGVAGVHMVSTYLKRIFHDQKECEDEEDIFCYLVDENGYIISSKEKDEISKFFGAVEGTVMEDLIDQNVYVKYNFTDVQATCEPVSDESSSSIRLLDPLFSFVNYAKWWTQTIALSLIQYSFYAVLTGTNQVEADDSAAKTFPCFKNLDLYFREEVNEVVKNGSILYRGCDRSYESYVVKDTNLLLVIVNIKNSTYCKSKTKKMNIDEIDDYEGSCDLVDKYRVAADKFGTCSPMPKESADCSSCKLLIPSIVLLVLQVMLLLLLRHE